MIFTETDIVAKSWLVREVCNLVLKPLTVDKVFVIGSYASGKQTMFSDLDFLVQLVGDNKWINVVIPSWIKIKEVHDKIGSNRIHVIFGTENAARSLHEKHKGQAKDYSYREIKQGGVYAASRTSNLSC